MKHVLDEIRRLKTELAFQHNAILELKHELESRQVQHSPMLDALYKVLL